VARHRLRNRTRRHQAIAQLALCVSAPAECGARPRQRASVLALRASIQTDDTRQAGYDGRSEPALEGAAKFAEVVAAPTACHLAAGETAGVVRSSCDCAKHQPTAHSDWADPVRHCTIAQLSFAGIAPAVP